MAFELKVPTGGDLTALGPLVPVFLTYALSFLNVGTYWNNHHHLFQAAGRVDSAVLWANLNLLFWLSLMPFATGWMGANSTAPVLVAAYGVGHALGCVFLLELATYSCQPGRAGIGPRPGHQIEPKGPRDLGNRVVRHPLRDLRSVTFTSPLRE